uniref:P24 oleosin isoform A n=1 Tax=Glycine max TaxID=3847 RepID=OLEO1_SOYBN|nr:RecName: Full=P24 oleosin isoform A; AltName: Full=P89 [Glycine max]AAA17854.1 p24 oleosin isoform A [Glycine max]
MTTQVPPHSVQVHTTTTHRYEAGVVPPGARFETSYEAGVKAASIYHSERGPTTSQVLAVLAGLPVGGILLLLAGLTLAGTLTGLAVATPLFVLFSPVLVPATVAIGLAVAGFLTSGAFGLTALSSFSWILNYIRETQPASENLAAAAKHHLAEAAEYVGQKTKEVGQKTKEVGQDIQSKAQDTREAAARDAREAAARDAREAAARDAKVEARDVKRTTVTATTATA